MSRLTGITAVSTLLAVFLFAPAAMAGAMLTKAVCDRLLQAETRNDVGYRPGVDVRGGKVVKADVRARNEISPLPTSVDVTVLLQDRFAVPRDPKFYKGEIPVSRFKVRQNGLVTYRGRPLAREDQQELSLICRSTWGAG